MGTKVQVKIRRGCDTVIVLIFHSSMIKIDDAPFEHSECPSVHTMHAIQHSQPALQCCLHQWRESPRRVAIVLGGTLLQQLA